MQTKCRQLSYNMLINKECPRYLKSLVPKERIGSSPISGTNKINAFL